MESLYRNRMLEKSTKMCMLLYLLLKKQNQKNISKLIYKEPDDAMSN